MNRPGGTLPEVIVKVSTAPLLVSRNPSYGWPTTAPGSTQTPFTRVPPLLVSHSRVIDEESARAGSAMGIPASRKLAAATAISVFRIAPPPAACRGVRQTGG